MLEKLSQAAEAWSPPLTVPTSFTSTAGVSLPKPACETTKAQSRARPLAGGPLPLRSPNPFILFRTHLIASAKASGVVTQVDVSKMASSLWADMDDVTKQTWKEKAAFAKESLASKRAEHPELCMRKRAKRCSSDRHRRRESANASAYTQVSSSIYSVTTPFDVLLSPASPADLHLQSRFRALNISLHVLLSAQVLRPSAPTLPLDSQTRYPYLLRLSRRQPHLVSSRRVLRTVFISFTFG